MKKILFLIPFLVLLSSCAPSIRTNKLKSYDEKIRGDLSVYIAITDGNKQKTEWSNIFGEKLSEQLRLRGIKATVSMFESDHKQNHHNFTKTDIKTTNANGLTMLIVETTQSQTVSGGRKQSKFSVKLTDHNIEKDVWVSEFTTMWGSIGGADAIAGFSCKQVINALQKDKLIESY